MDDQDIEIKGILSTEELFTQASKIYAQTDLYPESTKKVGLIVAITPQGRQTLDAFSSDNTIKAKNSVILERIVKKKEFDVITYKNTEKIYAVVSAERDEENWLNLL
ncbi:hypothetical protein [Xylocopilactobacillus apicola]|uniref:hypothetical protein n=1 Tax=Xylocopilactobacillus apicola TaxID=2932184 RepID=UPI002952D009|nr:hypothetical protein [Xylocopilactobacillus apicola]